ncbi:uncharacterized protein LOC114828606 [Galendromus occidentalis]|uniref:Uncharacterized protein LOC114828606 n=1 Tax=Galendromus occidentalis TaxID=34638 RepID=A0AAJ7SIH7_9ACAR|nr:uncharacterized protein LOC114828606 [Galendromus occidentalis]
MIVDEKREVTQLSDHNLISMICHILVKIINKLKAANIAMEKIERAEKLQHTVDYLTSKEAIREGIRRATKITRKSSDNIFDSPGLKNALKEKKEANKKWREAMRTRNWHEILRMKAEFRHKQEQLTEAISVEERRVTRIAVEKYLRALVTSDRKGFGDLINDIFEGREPIPEDWKRGRVSLLEKPNSKTGDLETYRPTTVSTVLYRIFTKILTTRITEWMEKEKILGEMQCGFRRDRRGADNIFILTSAIEFARNKERNAGMLPGLFESVRSNIPHEVLGKTGRPGYEHQLDQGDKDDLLQ